MNAARTPFKKSEAADGDARDLDEGSRERDRIPKGFRHKAQGCEERATLGSCVRSMTTLKGLRPTATAVQRGRNPVGVVKHRPPLPRVARSSQPWALLRNPFGILSLLKTLRLLFWFGFGKENGWPYCRAWSRRHTNCSWRS